MVSTLLCTTKHEQHETINQACHPAGPMKASWSSEVYSLMRNFIQENNGEVKQLLIIIPQLYLLKLMLSKCDNSLFPEELVTQTQDHYLLCVILALIQRYPLLLETL